MSDDTPILGTVRASSCGDLFDCGYRWYWKNIMGLRGRSGGASVVGTAIHKGTAAFDKGVLDNERVTVEEAVDVAADAARSPKDEKGNPTDVDWDDEAKLTADVAIDYAVKLTNKYCQQVAPHMNYKAVEVRCNALDVTTEHGIVRLTGTTDRVRDFGAQGEGIGDFKSGARAVEGIKEGAPRAVTKGHVAQLGIYTMMTEAETGRLMTGPATIVGFQVNSKLHIAEAPVLEPKRALIGTPGQPGLIERAAIMLKSGLFHPNPKSILCTEKYCPAWDRCIYHE